MSQYVELLRRIDRETTGAPGSAQNRHKMLRDAAQAIRTLSKERDMAVEALRKIEVALMRGDDAEAMALAQLEASKGEG